MKKCLKECPRCNGTGKVLDDVAFGKEMTKSRKKLGITCTNLAAKMELSIGYVNDLEHGRRHWHERTINKYNKALASFGKPKPAAKGKGKG